jgi:hypothetical protein
MASNLVYYPVESSNVQEIAYDHEAMDLYVRFLPKANSNGSLYVYHGVEPDVFSSMMDSSSAGQFVWQYLRNRYEYARVE